MDVLAFLIMVLLLLAMGRLVLAALAIQKNTREVADHFKMATRTARGAKSSREAASGNNQGLDGRPRPLG
jgi:hypothetical protein